MINGVHVIVQSTQPDADRAFFQDVLGLSHVDVGGGWLIFALPPAEVAVHPSDKDSVHELYLMCEDVNELVKELTARGITCGPIEDQGWGLLTAITLPGGGTLSAYEPRHARPTASAPSRASTKRPAPPKAKPSKSQAKKPAKAKPPAKKRAAKPEARKASAKKPAKKAPKGQSGRLRGRRVR